MGKDDSPSVVFLKDFTAGQFAGMAQVIVGHPLDTIKVVLQTQPNPPIYSSATDCFKKILATDGPGGLFKGMLSPLFCRRRHQRVPVLVLRCHAEADSERQTHS